MNWAAVLWLVLFVLCLVAEGATVTLVSVWFAVGALIAMICALLGVPFGIQVALFLVASCALLALLRPILKRFMLPGITKTNVDAVIGTTGTVIDPIDNLSARGQVKLGAMEWTARSTSGAPIDKGVVVRVDRIEGVKVFVTPL